MGHMSFKALVMNHSSFCAKARLEIQREINGCKSFWNFYEAYYSNSVCRLVEQVMNPDFISVDSIRDQKALLMIPQWTLMFQLGFRLSTERLKSEAIHHFGFYNQRDLEG